MHGNHSGTGVSAIVMNLTDEPGKNWGTHMYDTP